MTSLGSIALKVLDAPLKSGAPVPRVGTGERSAGVHTCDGGV